MQIATLILAVALVVQPEATEQPAPDGVETTVRAYVEGVLDADAARVQEAAHELLAKRRVADEYWGQPSRDWLKDITREQIPGMIDALHAGSGVSPADPAPDVVILSWTESTAAAKVETGAGLQLLHLVGVGDEWLVVDDAYDLTPEAPDKSDERLVRTVVTDYARGIYERSPIRALASCHTSVAKRDHVVTDAGAMLDPTSYDEMSLFVSAYNGYWGFEPRRARREINVLSLSDSIASVRLDGENWTDLIHLAKLNGEWLIIDILTVSR